MKYPVSTVFFSLFNFIQETNDEVTRQQETVEKLQKDMRRFKKEKEMKSEHAYSIINSLKSKRTNAEDRTYQIKSRLAEARLELLQLCTGVSQMFSHVGCSWEAGETVIGDDGGGATNGGPGNGRGHVETLKPYEMHVCLYPDLRQDQV